MDGREINTFGNLINSVMSRISGGGESGGNVADAWTRILLRIKSPVNESEGSNMAEHSRVTDLKQGLLFIEVDHPGWIELIQLHKKYIMRGLEIECPELGITNLAFNLKGNRADVGKSFDYGKNFEAEKKRFEEKIKAEERILENATPQIAEKNQNSAEKTVEVAPELQKLLDKLKSDMLTNSKE